jgi:hypothetical protein
MSDLDDQFIDETFGGLLHTASQAVSSSDIKRVYDGYGNETPISLSKDAFRLGSVSYPLSAATDGSALIYEAGVATFKSLLNSVYPIGCVYFSTVDTSPSTIFGGTWVRISQGRFIAGVGTGSDGTNTKTLSSGDTGGTYNHTLTINEMPAHSHTFDTRPDASAVILESVQLGPVDGNTKSTSTVGGSQPHENTPPAYGLHVWSRTA